jgi:hypothetical protein
MKHGIDQSTWATLVLILVIGAGWGADSCGCARASANGPRHDPHVDDQLAVAILVVNEADLRASDDEVMAIVEVVRRRADRAGVSPGAMAQRYGRTAFDRDRERRRWVPHLLPLDVEPEGWAATTVPWSWKDRPERPSPARRWTEIYALVGRALADEERHRCDRAPDHWGSPRITADRLRSQRAILEGRWREVNCGDTRNTFFRVVGLSSPRPT